MKVLLILTKSLEKRKLNFYRTVLLHMKTRIGFNCFVNDCLRKHFFDSNLPQTLPNTISVTNLETLRFFTLLQPEIRAIKLQKGTNRFTW